MITDNEPEKTQEQENQNSGIVVKVVDEKTPEVTEVEPTPPITEQPIVEAPKEEIVPTPEVVEEHPKPEFSDEAALAYLKEKHGIEVASVDDLKPKDQKKIDAALEKAQEFFDKTGNRNLADFLETQKDWKAEAENNPESVIKQKLALDNPSLSKSDIDFLYSDEYEYDKENVETDDDERRRKIKHTSKLQESINFFESRKSEYEIPKGSLEDLIPDNYKEAFKTVQQLQSEREQRDTQGQEAATYFQTETDKVFSDDFKGFDIKVGDETLTIKPENIAQTKEFQSKLDNSVAKHIDEQGKVKNAKEYHLALFAFNNPQEYAKHFYEMGKANYAEKLEKESKNITMDNPNRVASVNQAGITVKVV